MRISGIKVHLGTAAFSTATRRHVLLVGAAAGPLQPNCSRQVKETGGRCAAVSQCVPGSRSAVVLSPGWKDTAGIFRVCFTT